MKWQPRIASALMIVAASAPQAWAQGPSKKYGDLLKRIPERANVMLMVDVDGLFNSPLGRREKWRERAADRPTGVLGVSADVSKFVVAAGVDLQTLDEHWKLAMLETRSSPPQLSVLAGREGGYVEQVETQNVAWTPRDFYLFSFPGRIIGFAMPADRQALAGWIESTLVKPRTFPPSWADRAIFRADAGSQIVLAVNLDHAIAPKQVEAWSKQFESVKKARLNGDLLGQRLGGAKSAFLQVDVKETIQGTLRVEFEFPVDYFKPVAKELILTTLEDLGAQVDDLRRWDLEGKDNAITMTGRLSEDSVRRVLSVVAAPRLTPAYESPGEPSSTRSPEPTRADQPPAEPSKDVALKATKQYFRSVVDVLDSLKTQKAETKKSLKLWYDRSAKQIEDLPLLNVDNDLLAWGSTISRTLREMAFGINSNSKDQAYRAAGTANNYYGGYGYGYGGSRTVDVATMSKQSNAMLDVEMNRRWETIEISVADTRKMLVQKYMVDF